MLVWEKGIEFHALLLPWLAHMWGLQPFVLLVLQCMSVNCLLQDWPGTYRRLQDLLQYTLNGTGPSVAKESVLHNKMVVICLK